MYKAQFKHANAALVVELLLIFTGLFLIFKVYSLTKKQQNTKINIHVTTNRPLSTAYRCSTI